MRNWFQEASNKVNENQSEALEILRGMVRIDTCNPPGRNYDRLVDFLEPLYADLGFKTRRVIVPDEKVKTIPYELEGPRVNLVASQVAGKEPVSLYGHIDTVPIEEKWSVDPFAGEIRDGKLFGRGAADMKGGIAALIYALRIMLTLNLQPNFDMHCLMCTDEEIGVYPGALHLAQEGYVKGHVVSLEGGYQEPLLSMASFGALEVSVTTIGRSAHSGRNWRGVNAVEAMAPVLNELMALKTEVERRESSVPAFPMEGAPRGVMSPMFNLDVIKGGVKSNIIPSTCTLVINRRYIPEEKYEDVVSEIRQAIERGKARSKAIDVKTEYINTYPSCKYDTYSIYAKRKIEALGAIHGYREADFVRGGVFASTDMAMIGQVLSTDKFVKMGPRRISNKSAHAADEYVEIRDLLDMSRELIYYLTDWSSASR